MARIDTQNSLAGIEKEIKKNKHDIQSLKDKATKSVTKQKEQADEYDQRLLAVEVASSKSLAAIRTTQAQTVTENAQFKEYMTEEYIEFFRSKKKMRAEWGKYAKETEARVAEFLGMFDRYDANIASLNLVMPVLVEIVCLNSAFGKEDIEARCELSQAMRVENLPNQGYLMMDATSQNHAHKPPRATSAARTQLKSTKVAAEKPPADSQGMGSLYAKTLTYRGQQLELHEYTAILNYLVNTAYAQFRDHDSRSKFKHPKVFYDDAVI